MMLMSIWLHVSNVWRSFSPYAQQLLPSWRNWASLATWRCAVGQKPTSPLRAICCPRVTRLPTSTTAAWHGINVANPSGPFANKSTIVLRNFCPTLVEIWSLGALSVRILIPEDDTTWLIGIHFKSQNAHSFFREEDSHLHKLQLV